MRKVALAVLALVLGAAACTDSSLTTRSGRTQVLITDAPPSFGDISRVDLYISSIEASTSLDTMGGASWTVIAQPEKTFNLLDFQGGATALAGEVDLPAGQYRAIRVTINTSLSHVVHTSGQEAVVHWPVNGFLTLYAYVENALEVPEGGAQIVIDIDVSRTFLVLQTFAPPTEFVFSPWIRAINATNTGSIAGTVTGPDIEGNSTPVANATVLLMTAPGMGAMPAMIGTAETDAQGHYVMAYVHDGDYNLGVWAPSGFAYTQSIVGTHVSADQRTTVNFALTRSNGTDTSGIDTSGVRPGGPVASVSLRVGTPSGSTTIGTGDSVPVIADLRNADGQIVLGRQVTWSVTDSTVVSLEFTFGQYANLRALKNGTATLTATSEGKSASLAFTVSGTGGGGGGGGGGGPVASVVLTPASLGPAVGDSVGAYAHLYNAAGQELGIAAIQVAFTVSDSSVVSIMGAFGQSVIMRALKVGTTTLTATAQGKSGMATVTVH